MNKGTDQNKWYGSDKATNILNRIFGDRIKDNSYVTHFSRIET